MSAERDFTGELTAQGGPHGDRWDVKWSAYINATDVIRALNGIESAIRMLAFGVFMLVAVVAYLGVTR